MEEIKSFIIAISAVIGGIASTYLGGMDEMLTALIVFMLIDYITGLIVCLVFKNSPKTETGGASSKIGFKGLFKKFVVIMLIMVMVQADIVLKTNNFFREAAIWGFLANELFSLIENVGLMGIKLPKAFTNAFDVLKKKEEVNGEQE